MTQDDMMLAFFSFIALAIGAGSIWLMLALRINPY